MKIKLANNLTAKINQPIDFNYPAPTTAFINDLRQHASHCALTATANILPVNSYYQQGRQGTDANMLTRQAVRERLEKIAKQLLPDYGLMIFDTFRRIKTQADLFAQFCEIIQKRNDHWTTEQIETEAKKFAAHPNAPGHFAIPPHNSGGAVDLAIYQLSTKKACPFGSAFDEISSTSNTDFFEHDYDLQFNISPSKWQQYRHNRRVLYHLMVSAGFVNFRNEWWHYDLGDCLWADELQCDWLFDSMEQHHPSPI